MYFKNIPWIELHTHFKLIAVQINLIVFDTLYDRVVMMINENTHNGNDCD